MKSKVFLFVAIMSFLVSCSDEQVEPDATACFEYNPQSNIGIGEEITFENCSENAYSYTWDFGDGSISYEQNPTHTYAFAGAYGVLLISSNDNSTDFASSIINVTGGLNGFSYDNNFYALDNIVVCDYTAFGEFNIVLSSSEIAYDCSTHEWSEGIGHYISFTVNANEIAEGSYILYENDLENEVMGEFGIGWSPSNDSGEIWSEFSFGILTINKISDKYELTYTFVGSSKRLTGYFLEE